MSEWESWYEKVVQAERAGFIRGLLNGLLIGFAIGLLLGVSGIVVR